LQAAVRASKGGRLGKRAGGMCVALSECSSSSLQDCAAGAAASVDLCSVDGTSTGPAVPDTVPAGQNAAAVPENRCVGDKDYGPDWQCSMLDTSQQCSCSEGTDTCVVLGTLRPTPCKACSNCLRAMRGFAAQQLAVTNAGAVAQAFGQYCGNLSAYAGTFACQPVQAAIASSTNGGLGKRPAVLCSMLRDCALPAEGVCEVEGTQPNTTIPAKSLDACTVDGMPGGALVPGVSASLDVPAGKCLGASDADVGQVCSFASGQQLCTCKGGKDTCVRMGTLVQTDCGRCSQCVSQAAAFTTAQQDTPDAQLAAVWTKFCTGPLARASAACDAVAAAVRANPWAGRRAGLLCGLLKDCAQAAGKEQCAVKVQTDATGTKTARLDMCTVEGIEDGTAVAGTAPSFSFTGRRCFSDADIKDDGLTCDVTTPGSTSTVCVCDAGVDTCRTLGTVVKTPCRQCNDCLKEWGRFAAQQRFQTASSAVAQAFAKECTSSGRSLAACAAVNSSIIASTAGNYAKRAGLVCQALGECNAAAYGANCSLSAPRAASPGSLTSASQLDLCSLEGLPNGTALPGVSNQLPTGGCDSDGEWFHVCMTGGGGGSADTSR
jgi:hypothetical protein